MMNYAAKVDGLIRAYHAAGSFLEEPIAKINEENPSEFWKAANATQDETTDSGNTEGKLANIGPYKLLQQIGEGGMGSVLHGPAGETGQTTRGTQGHQGRDGFQAGDRPV